jgi:hypothetical protein
MQLPEVSFSCKLNIYSETQKSASSCALWICVGYHGEVILLRKILFDFIL